MQLQYVDNRGYKHIANLFVKLRRQRLILALMLLVPVVNGARSGTNQSTNAGPLTSRSDGADCRTARRANGDPLRGFQVSSMVHVMPPRLIAGST